MSSLAARVLRTIRRFELLPPATRVVVGVSGGSDSVALLHLLLELQSAAGFRVAGLAHVNHQLRTTAADADEAFCRRLAASLSLPIEVEQVDVRACAARESRSLEDAARVVRYQALARAARRLGAERIAVGHTKDDQAETVLLKLLRGAGTRGLAAIRPINGVIVRPLLEVGREELRGWLAERQLPFVDDETNDDVRLRRNAVRHRVMPVLGQHFGPAVQDVLARHAAIAAEDEAVLGALAERLADQVIEADKLSISVDWVGLRDAPLALQRRVALQALGRAGVREPGFEQARVLLEVARGSLVGSHLAGGLDVRRDGQRVVIGPRTPVASPGDFAYELQVPGSVWVPEAARVLEARCSNREAPDVERLLTSPAGVMAVVGADELPSRLVVRSWCPGDALRPLGLGGRKKVQDLFVDRKVPRTVRRRLPLVVDRDRIVWVPGHAIDEAYRVTAATRAVVVLSMSAPGGRE